MSADERSDGENEHARIPPAARRREEQREVTRDEMVHIVRAISLAGFDVRSESGRSEFNDAMCLIGDLNEMEGFRETIKDIVELNRQLDSDGRPTKFFGRLTKVAKQLVEDDAAHAKRVAKWSRFYDKTWEAALGAVLPVLVTAVLAFTNLWEGVWSWLMHLFSAGRQ